MRDVFKQVFYYSLQNRDFIKWVRQSADNRSKNIFAGRQGLVHTAEPDDFAS
ncbi:hypothetical protein HMPREF0602_0352 [Neisseria meningitidis ATCC 13091]|uniref:Uncharacterized protein n=1 Tax=Neisseria meningitidis serogroup B (strain ATCC 13091 / M2091) TaxID=862513 RepID=E0N772_NEIM3|nr:hypothetical protein HMPREF0602_0352 [Neisseria meningitidis ATCC 13091]